MSATTILLLPLLLIVLAGVLELGAARVVAERARIAADLATVTAVNDQDDAELARTGLLRTSPDADRIAREHLALNLEPIAAALAATPSAVAAAAEIVVSERSVRLRAELPVRTPLFGALIARPVTVVQLLSTSAAR